MARRGSRIETIIISIFFLAVALWAVNKCTSKRHEIVQRVKDFTEAGREETDKGVETAAEGSETGPRKKTDGVPRLGDAPPEEAPGPAPAAPPQNLPPLPKSLTSKPAATPVAESGLTVLYVSVDGLNVRSEPGLKGKVVASLRLHDPVYFLQEQTDWTQEINLGFEKVTDHWVKVRTKSGKEGWVFGAGVHYFKKKRNGAN